MGVATICLQTVIYISGRGSQKEAELCYDV